MSARVPGSMSVGEELIGRRARARARRAATSGVPQAHRFRWALIGLVAVGVAALGGALALSSSNGRSRNAGGIPWSSWSPTDGGVTGAQEIADFLAPYYRATPSTQLAVISAVNLDNSNDPTEIAVPSSGSSGGLLPLAPSSTMLFNFCGVGSKDCSIGVGQASTSRLLLLRREALELALYTFKYIVGIQTVVTVLPPGHTVQGCVGICAQPNLTTKVEPLDLAVAFDRTELTPWLNRPLSATLPGQLPPTVSAMPNSPEAELVSVITAHGLFSEQTEQAQNGGQVIVLSPVPPQ